MNIPRQNSHSVSRSTAWPAGSDQTSTLIREQDWSRKPLGPTEEWPPSLRTAVDLVLACQFPMIVLWGPDLLQIYNDAYLALMGAKHPAGMGQRTEECWPEVWHINEPIYTQIWQGETLTYEDQLYPIMRHGFLEEAYFTLCYSPVRDDTGSIAGVLVTVFETTHRINASKERDMSEASLRQSEERLRIAQHAGQLASWDWDLTTDDFIWSGNVEWVYGRPAEEVTPLSRILNYLHEDDRETVLLNVKRANDSGGEFDHEFRVFWPDGSLHWVAGKGRSVYSREGLPTRMIGINLNITARKLAEESLRVSEERLRLALSAANGVGIWDWDVQNDRLYADSKIAQVYGIDPARAAEGAPLTEYVQKVHLEDRAHVEQAIAQTLRTGAEYSAEYRLMQEDGSVRWVAARGRCILSPDGAPLRFAGVTTDISDRKQIEEALRTTEKLAAVGRLASSIAHEINNPLEAVTNLLYLIGTTSDEKEWPVYLAQAQKELARVAQITTHTLRFHQQSTHPERVQMAELLDSVLALYQGRLAQTGIVIERRFRNEAPILCYSGDLRQVLSNLIGNAYDATREGDHRRLLVRTRLATDWRTGQQGVRVTVADNGEGMSAATRARIFEPFFTTKGINGTGLGLWVSMGIVDKHHGSMLVRSSQKQSRSGTVFSMFVPDLNLAKPNIAA